ncbi:HDOD domain-containing protein [Vibrio sp. S4M6]|uniref:HDOD domain-containing protein n=1 Tax=Vibrio sinus TaxID=2946865 RepID=UPI00202A4287|nr:HDOD domain-containing protein [Vibrio sinus]MCL9781658.1 HDOD domain-containing protein [Vibrio sinus]
MNAPLITRINELPRIQKILQELLDMVNQEDVEFGPLSDKISMDQVLSARLLRLANSAHFGASKKIGSTNEALLRVGTGPVRTLVVASVLSGVFNNIPTLDMNEYWSNTFEISVIASKLAEETGLDGNDIFTIGVLHNIGELMIHTLAPNEALKVVEKVQNGKNVFDAQEEVLDVSAPTLGAKLAKSWSFPEEMVDAIAHFHQPRESEISPKHAVILHFSRAIHETWETLATEAEKEAYLKEHPDSRLLSIPTEFMHTIDKNRGNGQEMANQLLAS